MKRTVLILLIISLSNCTLNKKENIDINNIPNKDILFYDTITYVPIYFYKSEEDKNNGIRLDMGIFEELDSNIDSCIMTNSDKIFVINQSEKTGWIDKKVKHDLFNVFTKTRLFDYNGIQTDTIIVEKRLYVIMNSW